MEGIGYRNCYRKSDLMPCVAHTGLNLAENKNFVAENMKEKRVWCRENQEKNDL